MLKCIINALLLLFAVALAAQTGSEDSEGEEVERGNIIYDVRLGVNLVRLGRDISKKEIRTGEFQATLGVDIFELSIDYGKEKNMVSSRYNYVNEGRYFRAGIDRNFVNNRMSGDAISLGLRYALADFRDELHYTLNNGFGSQTFEVSNPALKAMWLEFVVNLRGRIFSNLYSGFTLRWQFARKMKNEGSLKAFNIPGFGNTKRNNSTAFDYYLMWRIPFVK